MSKGRDISLFIIKYLKRLTANHKFCLSAVHCVWDEWILGECSTTCGVGTRTNTRVKVVTEANGGTCDGQPYEIEECKITECPGK